MRIWLLAGFCLGSAGGILCAQRAGAQIAKKLFDQPAVIQSCTVDAAVLDIVGGNTVETGDVNFQFAGSYSPLQSGVEVGTIGKTPSSARSFGFFAAVVGFASVDVWSEYIVQTPPIPDKVGDEEIDYVEVVIRGRVREFDFDQVACGAA